MNSIKLAFLMKLNCHFLAYFSSNGLYFLIITMLRLINSEPNFLFRQWKKALTQVDKYFHLVLSINVISNKTITNILY
jgi:hypothetical protein